MRGELKRKEVRSGRLSSRELYEKLTHFRDSDESEQIAAQLETILEKAKPELSEGAVTLLDRLKAVQQDTLKDGRILCRIVTTNP